MNLNRLIQKLVLGEWNNNFGKKWIENPNCDVDSRIRVRSNRQSKSEKSNLVESLQSIGLYKVDKQNPIWPINFDQLDCCLTVKGEHESV